MLIGQVPFHADSQVGVAMKHVNEELPDVQQRRPEVSAAAALVVERATAKDPAERYQEVGEMIDDLSTALEVEAARAGSTTGEATSVLDAVPPAKRKLSGAARWSWAAIALLVLVAGGALAGGAADQQRRRWRWRGAEGQGRDRRDLLGHRLRPRRATAKRTRRRSASPSTATRPAPPGPASTTTPTTFAGTKSGPNPGVGLYVTAESAAKPTRDGRSDGDPGLGRPDLRRRLRARRKNSRNGANRSARWPTPGETEEIELDVPTPSKYFLIWFTKAAPSRDQAGRYQVEISDVKLID